MCYMYLPPYSPDFSPIELAFSKIKSSIQCSGEAVHMALEGNHEDGDDEAVAMLYQHIYSVTHEDAEGWFRHCSYYD